MILGMSTASFTSLHVILSLIGIVAGLVMLFGMFAARKLERWTLLFLVTTMLTSLTGFLFPFDSAHLTPGFKVGVISVVLLIVAIVALYVRHLVGRWRWIYVVTAVMALYLNVFVLIVQCFEKIPALHALAPTQKEPPFAIAQLVALVLFVFFGVRAVKRFRPD